MKLQLYKTAKGMSHRNTDSETLNKLFREGLLIESEEGLKLPALYDEISAQVAEQGKTFADENCGSSCGSDCGIQLTERQKEILVLLRKDGTKVAGVIARVIAGVIGVSKRTVEEELSFLRKNGFIDKETKDNRSPWIVLKKNEAPFPLQPKGTRNL